MPDLRACKTCDKMFRPDPSAVARGSGIFCSLDCWYAFQRAMPLEDRFWPKVDRRGPDECWPWLGAILALHGYGAFYIRRGKMEHAHRVALRLSGVNVPPGSVVRHTCDNRPCVNPAHLRVGTQADNLADMAAKGRSRHGEQHWNVKLTDASVYEIRELAGTAPYTAIGRRYGISAATVCLIIQRKRWGHLP